MLSVVIPGFTTLICLPLADTQNYHLVSYILLFVVSILSTFMTAGPVLLASTLSAILWNIFFIPPHFTIQIEKTGDILIFGLFFIIALVNGVLTTRVRQQEKIAREREKRTNALFQLTKELSKARGIDDVLKVASEGIRINFGVHPIFVLQEGNDILNPSLQLHKDKTLSGDEFVAAEWSFRNLMTTGAFTDNSFGIKGTFFPLKGTMLNPGVIAVNRAEILLNEQRSYWETFIALISNALEREFLGEMAEKVRFLKESDRLYKTLFNSISHELRIPVATIMGASDSIVHSTNPENTQKALSEEIFMASLRLNRLIENLLNMSRLESGHIEIRLDWYDINDLINKVLEGLKDELRPFTFRINIPEEMPSVRIDFGLMEQVLYNLIYNSTQYAPAASIISFNAWHENNQLIMEITDNGPGFPENEIHKVFRKFYRIDERKTGGLGLGLSIAKGFIEAHKGEISIHNNKNGGARLLITIPSERPEIKNI